MLFRLDTTAKAALACTTESLRPEVLLESQQAIAFAPDTLALLLAYFTEATSVTAPSAAFDYARPLGMPHHADATWFLANASARFNGIPVIDVGFSATGSDLLYTELDKWLPWVIHLTTFTIAVGSPARKYKGYAPNDGVAEAAVNESVTRKKLAEQVVAAVRTLELHYPLQVQAYRDYIKQNDFILEGVEGAVTHLNAFMHQCTDSLTFVAALAVWPHLVTFEVNDLEYSKCANTDVAYIKSNPFLRAPYSPIFPITNESRVANITIETRSQRTFNLNRWIYELYDRVYDKGDVFTLDYAMSQVGSMPPVEAMNHVLKGAFAELSLDEQCMVHTIARSPLFRNSRNSTETLSESIVQDADYEDESLQYIERDLMEWATEFYTQPNSHLEMRVREVLQIIQDETDDEPLRTTLLKIRAEHSALKQYSVGYIKHAPRRILTAIIESRKKAASDARMRNPEPVLHAFIETYTQYKAYVRGHCQQAAEIDAVLASTHSNYTLGVVLLTLTHLPILNKYSQRRLADEPRVILQAIKNIAMSEVVAEVRRTQAENCLASFIEALAAHVANKSALPPVSTTEARLHILVNHLESLTARIEAALKRLED